MKWFDEPRRAYTYRVLLALGGAAAFYGFLSTDEIIMWAGIVATVLMISPTANTHTKRVPEITAYQPDAAAQMLIDKGAIKREGNGYDQPKLPL